MKPSQRGILEEYLFGDAGKDGVPTILIDWFWLIVLGKEQIKTYRNLHPLRLLFFNIVIHPVELSSLRNVIREW